MSWSKRIAPANVRLTGQPSNAVSMPRLVIGICGLDGGIVFFRRDPIDVVVGKSQNLIQRIIEGYAPVQCPFTFSKRLIRSLEHLVNNRPMVGLFLLMMLALFVLGGVFFFIRLL